MIFVHMHPIIATLRKIENEDIPKLRTRFE